MKKIYEYDGRACEPCDDNRLYYINEPHDVGTMEREWLNNLKKEIAETSQYEHNVVCNLTWFRANWEETEPLRKLVHSLGPTEHVKIWYVGTVDGNHWIKQKHMDFYHYFVRCGYAHSFVGYAGEHWYSWYPEWFINNNLRANVEDFILNTNPKYLYLCYNRKPRIHRTWLIESLIKEKLLDKGWVTFEKGHYPEIDGRSAETDQDKHTTDKRFSRPEDILSVGDLEIWQNSFVIVTSETDHDDPYQLSEKTWKPIFGLRPFLINGRREVYDVLERLGFYTPKDFFKNNKLDCHYTSVVDQLKQLYKLPAEEYYKTWEDMYEMLLYNRKRMFEMANCDPTKILNWPQAKAKP
jgi:hypothetical protein